MHTCKAAARSVESDADEDDGKDEMAGMSGSGFWDAYNERGGGRRRGLKPCVAETFIIWPAQLGILEA